MQIENNPAYTLLQPARGPQNQGLFDINRADPARSGAAVSSATEARPVNNETVLSAAGGPATQTGAVRGTTQNLLSPNTAQLAIDQQVKESAQADRPAGISYDDRIATDPAFAAEEARLAGMSYDLPWIPLGELIKGNVPAQFDLEDPANPLVQVRKQRTALYEQKVAQGVPPAQIYMDIMEFNLSLPDSYYADDVLDPFDLFPPGYHKSQHQSSLDMLRAAMARAEAANSQETAV